jgi:hypothetical protein
MNRTAVAFLAIVMLALSNPSKADVCSEREAFAAETVTDYLDSWDNVHLFFEQFRKCYDAAIAEGANDKIQQLWSNYWSELSIMVKLTQEDPAFKSFIFERIKDEDFPRDRFAIVVQHATQDCPSVAQEFCRAVLNEAARAKQRSKVKGGSGRLRRR